MINIYEKNKINYKYYIISKQSLFIWTIFLIYLTQKGLSFTEVMLLNSISGITTFIFEIPSGIISDRINRKKILILGELLTLISFLLILSSNNFYILGLNSIFSGIGQALISGSAEALIYESFLTVKKQDYFKEYLSNVQMKSLRVSACSTLLSGVLYKINCNLPLVLSIIVQFISIFFLFKLVDSRKVQRYKYNLKNEINIQVNNIKEIIRTKGLLKLFYIYIIMMIIISNINYTSQTYLTDIGIEYQYIGLVFFLFNIISSFGAKYSSKLNFNILKILGIYSMLLIVLYLGNIYIALITFSISRFINGMTWPILNSDINKKITSDNRATILSYKNLFVQISFIIFDPLIGLLLDSFSFKITYLIMGITIFTIFILIILINFQMKNLSVKKIRIEK